MTDRQSIEELCREQGIWLTKLEQRLAEEKRDHHVLVSWWHGRRSSDLPPRLPLKSCADQEVDDRQTRTYQIGRFRKNYLPAKLSADESLLRAITVAGGNPYSRRRSADKVVRSFRLSWETIIV